jgi:hypothetical protein
MSKSLKRLALLMVAAIWAASSAPVLAWTPDDTTAAVGGVGLLLGIFAGAAEQADQMRQQEAQQHAVAASLCIKSEMVAALSGLENKSEQVRQRMKYLIDNRSITTNLLRKCNPNDEYVDWRADTVQTVVVGWWNAWVDSCNASVAKRRQEEAAAVAQARSKSAMDAYFACLSDKVVLAALASDEVAETIVSAARGMCSNERLALMAAYGPAGQAEAMVDLADRTIKDQMVARIIEARAARAAAKAIEGSRRMSPSGGSPQDVMQSDFY